MKTGVCVLGGWAGCDLGEGGRGDAGDVRTAMTGRVTGRARSSTPWYHVLISK